MKRKTNATKIEHKTWMIMLAIAFGMALFQQIAVDAAPNGATITYYGNSTGPDSAPENLTDAKGSINTVKFFGLQQNMKWKAYVGNVSGKLTLDDANSYTIYDWSTGAITGKVFASRSNSINWGTVNCTSPANLTLEESALGVTPTATDSIRNTFNWTGHKAFSVGTIPISGCNSTVTYMNDTNPGQSASGRFQEALLSDGISFLYAALINASNQGYRNDSTYDFQMIVADNVSSGSPASTYFFWVELI